MRRQDDRMVVDIALPHWTGTYIVDGDLTVAPSGRLFIYSNTTVHFAGTDRLQSGRDPMLCELNIEGDCGSFQCRRASALRTLIKLWSPDP